MEKAYKTILSDPAKITRDLPPVEFFFSKEPLLYSFFIHLFIIFTGVYLIYTKPQLLVIGAIISTIGAILSLADLTKLLDRKPVLILSSSGIWGRKFETVLWSDIESTRFIKIKNKPYLDLYKKSSITVNERSPYQRVEIWKLEENELIEFLITEFSGAE